MKWNSYLRLMRFHKPVGILLLWFPTAWALWFANQGNPPLRLVILFLLGTTLMRAAGCIVNDIADRHIDGLVKRTKMRPLAAGEVKLTEALILLILLLLCAFLILIQLSKNCFYYALLAVFVTVLYPFCKRFIQAPQFVLGIAYSMGIPMAYVASNVLPNLEMINLFSINFFWIIAYDTQYAMVDRDDDLRLGVKSTAILFADYDKLIIGILQFLLHALWIPLAIEAHLRAFFWPFWLIGGVILLLQQKLIAKREREECFKGFSLNNWYGLVLWAAIVSGFQIFS